VESRRYLGIDLASSVTGTNLPTVSACGTETLHATVDMEGVPAAVASAAVQHSSDHVTAADIYDEVRVEMPTGGPGFMAEPGVEGKRAPR